MRFPTFLIIRNGEKDCFTILGMKITRLDGKITTLDKKITILALKITILSPPPNLVKGDSTWQRLFIFLALTKSSLTCYFVRVV